MGDFPNTSVMQQLEVYLRDAASLFDDGGKLKSESAGALRAKFMTAFERWVDTVLGAGSPRLAARTQR